VLVVDGEDVLGGEFRFGNAAVGSEGCARGDLLADSATSLRSVGP
jgi:hypothetical protein